MVTRFLPLTFGPARLAVAALASVLVLSACDAAGGVLVPGDRGDYLDPGLYEFQTWSYGGSPLWWGDVDLRVTYGGDVTGTYLLPDQCSDSYGYTVDCYGYVYGRVYDDGTVRLDFDEGWMRLDAVVDRYSQLDGTWNARFVGYSGSGRFELLPY